jgi:hypothetical protein
LNIFRLFQPSFYSLLRLRRRDLFAVSRDSVESSFEDRFKESMLKEGALLSTVNLKKQKEHNIMRNFWNEYLKVVRKRHH